MTKPRPINHRPWVSFYSGDPGPDLDDAADTCPHGAVIFGDGDCAICDATLEEEEDRAFTEADREEEEDCEQFTRDHFDPDQFETPGGPSALRRATADNPRNLPCPTCGRANRLTPADVALHYQCDECAEKIETGG